MIADMSRVHVEGIVVDAGFSAEQTRAVDALGEIALVLRRFLVIPKAGHSLPLAARRKLDHRIID